MFALGMPRSGEVCSGFWGKHLIGCWGRSCGVARESLELRRSSSERCGTRMRAGRRRRRVLNVWPRCSRWTSAPRISSNKAEGEEQRGRLMDVVKADVKLVAERPWEYIVPTLLWPSRVFCHPDWYSVCLCSCFPARPEGNTNVNTATNQAFRIYSRHAQPCNEGLRRENASVPCQTAKLVPSPSVGGACVGRCWGQSTVEAQTSAQEYGPAVRLCLPAGRPFRWVVLVHFQRSPAIRTWRWDGFESWQHRSGRNGKIPWPHSPILLVESLARVIKHAHPRTRPQLRRQRGSPGHRRVGRLDPPHRSLVVLSLARHFALMASHECESIISVFLGGHSSSSLPRAAGATHVVYHHQCEWIMASMWVLQVPGREYFQSKPPWL